MNEQKPNRDAVDLDIFQMSTLLETVIDISVEVGVAMGRQNGLASILAPDSRDLPPLLLAWTVEFYHEYRSEFEAGWPSGTKDYIGTFEEFVNRKIGEEVDGQL